MSLSRTQEVLTVLLDEFDVGEHTSEDTRSIRSMLQSVSQSREFARHFAKFHSSSSTSFAAASHSLDVLGEYLVLALPNTSLRETAICLKSNIEMTLNKIFRHERSFRAHLTPSIHQARLLALQSALHRRYPLLQTEGCTSLSRGPVFYLTKGSALFQTSMDARQPGTALKRLSWELLTTKDSFRIIPWKQRAASASESGEPIAPSYCMDLEALEQEIQRDEQAGRLPCGIIATIGADIHQGKPFQCDDLVALRRVCDRHNRMWLHAEGGNVLQSALPDAAVPSPFKYADSISCQPLSWYGQHPPSGAMGLTFLRVDQSGTDSGPPETPGMVFDSLSESFSSIFMLWYQLISRPPSFLAEQLASQKALVKQFRDAFAEQKAVHVLCGPNAADHQHLLFFQVSPERKSVLQLAKLGAVDKISKEEAEQAAVNELNRWLYKRLEQIALESLDYYEDRDMERSEEDLEEEMDEKKGDKDGKQAPNGQHGGESAEATSTETSSNAHSRSVSLAAPSQTSESLPSTPNWQYMFQNSFTHINYYGHRGFLFHPFSSLLGPSGLSPDNNSDAVTGVVAVIVREMDLFVRAIELRDKFQQAINSHMDMLEWVDPRVLSADSPWVGLGAFRCVPNFIRTKDIEEDEERQGYKENLRSINSQLLELLSGHEPNLFVEGYFLESSSEEASAEQPEAEMCIVVQTSSLLADPQSIARIIKMVSDCVGKVEFPEGVQQDLKEVITRGIEEAQQKLQDEAVGEVLNADNLIRMLPVVGSVWNWWSPPEEARNQAIKNRVGHNFDLRSRQLHAVKFPERKVGASGAAPHTPIAGQINIQNTPLPPSPRPVSSNGEVAEDVVALSAAPATEAGDAGSDGRVSDGEQEEQE
eukprot:g39992.t1